MKKAILFHNPVSGDEQHSKELILSDLKKSGIECRYQSTKSGEWSDYEAINQADLLIVAGGDGTVRKFVKYLLKLTDNLNTPPIGILPFGTANNIAKTLNFSDDIAKEIPLWNINNVIEMDIGFVNREGSSDFFIEGAGFGIFPYLMKKMDEKEALLNNKETEERIKYVLKELKDIMEDYEARECTIIADGKNLSGVFIMAEFMNISSIGPNLFLTKPLLNDGKADVILIKPEDKYDFLKYVEHKLSGREYSFEFNPFRASEIEIRWDGSHVHIDDKIIETDKKELIKIKMKKNALKFFKKES